MRELILHGDGRTLHIKADEYEKFMIFIEDLEGDIEAISLSYEEAFKAFTLIFDAI